MLRTSPAPRDYLLLPSHPTPNGALHLGHIAGPYLKMDVLRRALERRGDRATLAFCLDSFDSYVLLRAHQLRMKEADVVSKYSAEIQADLAGLDIGVSLFLDPRSPDFETPYREAVLGSVQSQRACGAADELDERFLYSPSSGRFIVGAWLRGRCPRCNSECSGYSCEVCAGHHRPEEIKEPRARVEEGPLEWKTVRTLFMRVQDTDRFRESSAKLLSASDHTLVEGHLASSGASLRMSVPGTWGVPFRVGTDPTPQVVYPGFATLGLMLACGAEYARITGKNDPFHPDSDVVVICSFGLDNLVSRMLSCIGGAFNAGIRPPEALLLNRFYRLEGAKFSTSRNHAIWASTVAKRPRGFSDAVRFHLVATSPDDAETDFLAAEFRSTVAELMERWNSVIRKAASRPLQPTMTGATFDGLIDSLALQDEYLDLRAFRSRSLTDVVRAWVLRGEAGDDSPYWWLKGFALLAWPLVPNLGSALWRFLGHVGEPREADFQNVPEISRQTLPVFEFLPADVEATLERRQDERDQPGDRG